MELRKRKWIYNQLPKYEEGKVGNTLVNRNAGILSQGWPNNALDYMNVGNGLSTQTIATMNQQIGKEKAEQQQNEINRKNNIVSSIFTNGVNFAGSVINANTLGRSTGEIMADAGSRYVNNGMFTWQRQNEINSSKEMSDLHKQHVNNTLATVGTGAALGGTIGGPIGAGIGAAVGGIVGFIGGGSTHAKLRKRIQNARIQTENNNNFNFASAQGDWLNQQYDLNHAYTQDGQIYVAKYGKACGGLMKRK